LALAAALRKIAIKSKFVIAEKVNALMARNVFLAKNSLTKINEKLK
jgi:hypothetical protein